MSDRGEVRQKNNPDPQNNLTEKNGTVSHTPYPRFLNKFII